MALEPGLNDKIIIDEVEFYQSNKKVYLSFVSILVCIIVISLIHIKISESKKVIFVKSLDVPRKSNVLNDKILLIKNFMAENYSNPDLSFYDLQKATKLSAKEIREIFTNELKDSFKSYLKLIRIEQVKKALIVTDLTVAEIAYKCGYNDTPHFNRLFKSETGKSPKEFRKENIS